MFPLSSLLEVLGKKKRYHAVAVDINLSIFEGVSVVLINPEIGVRGFNDESIAIDGNNAAITPHLLLIFA